MGGSADRRNLALFTMEFHVCIRCSVNALWAGLLWGSATEETAVVPALGSRTADRCAASLRHWNLYLGIVHSNFQSSLGFSWGCLVPNLAEKEALEPSEPSVCDDKDTPP
jgi:hypothetical protein